MEARGWTAYRLASEAGLTESTIQKLFRRNGIPTLPTLEAVCSAFGITLSQFFADDDMVECTPDGGLDTLASGAEGGLSETHGALPA